MSLSVQTDIFFTSSLQFFDMMAVTISGSTKLYAITSTPDFRVYDPTTGAQTNTTLSVVAGSRHICLVAPGCGAIFSASTSQVDFVELTTQAKTSVTTGAVNTNSGIQGQQCAGNPSTHIAICTRSVSGSVGKADYSGSAPTCSTLSPASLSGKTATSVITKNNNFLIGTDSGIVYEMDSSGTIVTTLTLPKTNNVGTAPTIYVHGLSYSDPYLAITTSSGFLYVYNFSTTTLLWQGLAPMPTSTTTGTPLCAAACGTAIIGHGSSTSTNGIGIGEFYFGSGVGSYEAVAFNEVNTQLTFVGVDPISKKAWTSNNNTSNFLQSRIFNITTGYTTETTEIQNPVGTQVTGRIIRLRDPGVGKASVEVDQNIAAASTAVKCTDDHNYIEISLAGGTEKDDIREFKA